MEMYLLQKSKVNKLGRVYANFFIWVCFIFVIWLVFPEIFLFSKGFFFWCTGEHNWWSARMPSFTGFWRILTLDRRRKEEKEYLTFSFSGPKHYAARIASASAKHDILPFWWKAVVLNVYAASQHDRLNRSKPHGTTGTPWEFHLVSQRW